MKPGKCRHVMESARLSSDASPPGPVKKADDTLFELASNADRGLSQAEASARLARDGANDVPEEPSHPIVRFARKFWGLSAWMIEMIVVLSLVLHKYADLWVALSLLVVNAVLSFAQEQRASAAVTALRRKLRVTARVLRDGAWKPVAAHVLVRGDIVRLRSGDFVPADVQIIDGTLKIDQSALTGKSQEQERVRDGSLFSGSTIHQGEATAIVVGTGIRTYYGRTTQLVQSARPKLHAEEVVSRVVRWLFLIVGVLVGSRVDGGICRRAAASGNSTAGAGAADERSAGGAARHVHCQHGGWFHGTRAQGCSGHAPQRRRGCRQHGRSLRRQDRHVDGEPAQSGACDAAAGI